LVEADAVFATSNPGKMREIRAILNDAHDGVKISVQSMAEAGIEAEIKEDGATFEANALKKATFIMKLCGKIVLADDSGLEIDYLYRMPGVLSARYFGCNTPYEVKNKKLLEMMKDASDEQRTARFICAIAAAFPNGRVILRKGVFEGVIGIKPKGENGFGYDPIFYVPEYKMTAAEMPAELKNAISHRSKALRRMKAALREAF
jgi:XTP/dITP diphosphohydrolase